MHDASASLLPSADLGFARVGKGSVHQFDGGAG